MQETRRHIMEILRERREATVNEIVQDLCKLRQEKITAVTVRHHLGVLQEEGLVAAPQAQHRASPGRPRHVYTLTDNAEAFFPNNYQRLASGLLAQIQQHLPPEGVNVIIEGVAKDMAQEAKIPPGTLRERLDAVVNYLNEHGYDARWDTCESGYILQTLNCPYHHMTHEDDTLCNLDMRMIASMLGVVPRLMSRVSDGDNVCSYLVPVD